MSTPKLAATAPSNHTYAPNQLFKHRVSGEYCIRLIVPGGKHRFISLKTKDRLEALRRLRDTGVEKIVQVAGDEAFTDAIVESLTEGNRVTLEELVAEWLTDLALRVKRGSMGHPKTISGQFIKLFPPGTDVSAVTPTRIGAWINTAPTLQRRKRRLSVLEELFQYAFDQGYRKDNPTKKGFAIQLDDLTIDQMERTVKDPFLPSEFEKLATLKSPLTEDFWRFAIPLSWWLGLRMSDCCRLQWGSFCAVPGKLVVWQKKTSRRAELDLSEELLGGGVLIKLFAELKESVQDAVYVFPAWQQLYDERQPDTVHAFRQVCLDAGLDGVKTFACFRNAAAQRWERAGRSLSEIGELLGHHGTGNTQYYLETNKTNTP